MTIADLPNAYWAVPGRLLAGPYPCAADLPTATRRVAALLHHNVNAIIDLTQPGEYNLRPYWPLLAEQAQALGRHIERSQPSIPDLGTPSAEQMRMILDSIDALLAAGHIVYVHCYGGIGRTGTVIGCYFVRHGMRGDEALQAIVRLRRHLPGADRSSPEMPAQFEMVRTWRD